MAAGGGKHPLSYRDYGAFGLSDGGLQEAAHGGIFAREGGADRKGGAVLYEAGVQHTADKIEKGVSSKLRKPPFLCGILRKFRPLDFRRISANFPLCVRVTFIQKVFDEQCQMCSMNFFND